MRILVTATPIPGCFDGLFKKQDYKMEAWIDPSKRHTCDKLRWNELTVTIQEDDCHVPPLERKVTIQISRKGKTVERMQVRLSKVGTDDGGKRVRGKKFGFTVKRILDPPIPDALPVAVMAADPRELLAMLQPNARPRNATTDHESAAGFDYSMFDAGAYRHW